MLPPGCSDTGVVIPIAQHKEGVLEKAEEIRKELAKTLRVKLDASDKGPGFKFAEQERRGTPSVLNWDQRTSRQAMR